MDNTQVIIDMALDFVRGYTDMNAFKIRYHDNLPEIHTTLIEKTAELTGHEKPVSAQTSNASYEAFYGVSYRPRNVDTRGRLQYFNLTHDGAVVFDGPSNLGEMFSEVPESSLPAFALIELMQTSMFGDARFVSSKLGLALVKLVNKDKMWADTYETFLEAKKLRDGVNSLQTKRFKNFVEHQWGKLDLKKFTMNDKNEIEKFNTFSPKDKIETLILLNDAASFMFNPYIFSNFRALADQVKVEDIGDAFAKDLKTILAMLENKVQTNEFGKYDKEGNEFDIQTNEYLKYLDAPMSWLASTEIKKDPNSVLRKRALSMHVKTLTQMFENELLKDVTVDETFKNGSSLEKAQWLHWKFLNNDLSDMNELVSVYSTMTTGLKIFLVRQSATAAKHYASLLHASKK